MGDIKGVSKVANLPFDLSCGGTVAFLKCSLGLLSEACVGDSGLKDVDLVFDGIRYNLVHQKSRVCQASILDLQSDDHNPVHPSPPKIAMELMGHKENQPRK